MWKCWMKSSTPFLSFLLLDFYYTNCIIALKNNLKSLINKVEMKIKMTLMHTFRERERESRRVNVGDRVGPVKMMWFLSWVSCYDFIKMGCGRWYDEGGCKHDERWDEAGLDHVPLSPHPPLLSFVSMPRLACFSLVLTRWHPNPHTPNTASPSFSPMQCIWMPPSHYHPHYS